MKIKKEKIKFVPVCIEEKVHKALRVFSAQSGIRMYRIIEYSLIDYFTKNKIEN